MKIPPLLHLWRRGIKGEEAQIKSTTNQNPERMRSYQPRVREERTPPWVQNTKMKNPSPPCLSSIVLLTKEDGGEGQRERRREKPCLSNTYEKDDIMPNMR